MLIGQLRKGREVDGHREIALRQPLNDVSCAEFQVERTGGLAPRRGGRQAEYRKLMVDHPEGRESLIAKGGKPGSGGNKETVLDVTVRAAVAAGERSRV